MYAQLYRSLQINLTVPRKSRGNADFFIQRTSEELDKLSNTELNFPPHILRQYERKFGNSSVALIDEVNGITSPIPTTKHHQRKKSNKIDNQ